MIHTEIFAPRIQDAFSGPGPEHSALLVAYGPRSGGKTSLILGSDRDLGLLNTNLGQSANGPIDRVKPDQIAQGALFRVLHSVAHDERFCATGPKVQVACTAFMFRSAVNQGGSDTVIDLLEKNPPLRIQSNSMGRVRGLGWQRFAGERDIMPILDLVKSGIKAHTKMDPSQFGDLVFTITFNHSSRPGGERVGPKDWFPVDNASLVIIDLKREQSSTQLLEWDRRLQVNNRQTLWTEILKGFEPERQTRILCTSPTAAHADKLATLYSPYATAARFAPEANQVVADTEEPTRQGQTAVQRRASFAARRSSISGITKIPRPSSALDSHISNTSIPSIDGDERAVMNQGAVGHEMNVSVLAETAPHVAQWRGTPAPAGFGRVRGTIASDSTTTTQCSDLSLAESTASVMHTPCPERPNLIPPLAFSYETPVRQLSPVFPVSHTTSATAELAGSVTPSTESDLDAIRARLHRVEVLVEALLGLARDKQGVHLPANRQIAGQGAVPGTAEPEAQVQLGFSSETPAFEPVMPLVDPQTEGINPTEPNVSFPVLSLDRLDAADGVATRSSELAGTSIAGDTATYHDDNDGPQMDDPYVPSW